MPNTLARNVLALSRSNPTVSRLLTTLAFIGPGSILAKIILEALIVLLVELLGRNAEDIRDAIFDAIDL